MTATDIRVVFNRLLTPDADLATLTGEMQALANAPSVKFNSQLSLDKEAVIHYVHNESSNALILEPSNLNLGTREDANSQDPDQVRFRDKVRDDLHFMPFLGEKVIE